MTKLYNGESQEVTIIGNIIPEKKRKRKLGNQSVKPLRCWIFLQIKINLYGIPLYLYNYANKKICKLTNYLQDLRKSQ